MLDVGEVMTSATFLSHVIAAKSEVINDPIFFNNLKNELLEAKTVKHISLKLKLSWF